MATIDSTPEPKKVKRAKGPIRWEAIAPLSIVVLLIWAYFFFFFDAHARRALEYVGTQANGAQVDIADLDTSFWKASLEIRGIEVTNAENPETNFIEFGSMRWKMLWDALLRGKIVIDDASILDIRLGTKRAKPGRVLPPEPPSESGLDKMKAQALENAEQQFKQNVLGDAASLLQGTDPMAQLQSIGNELKSSKRIKELETEFKRKQAEWNERIARLPKNDEIKAYEGRAKAIKLDGFANPLEVQQSIQQIDQLVRDVDGKIKEVQSTGQSVGSELSGMQKSFNELKSYVDNDIKDLQNRLKIPSLDAGSIVKSIFGPLLLSRVKQVEKYMTKAREFIPPKKSASELAEYKKPQAHERGKGVNYAFGKPKAYPLFWLKHAALSSKESPGGPSGDMTGSLDNLSNDQPMLGLPLTLSFAGRFPASRIEGVKGLVTIDHRTETPVEKLNLEVGHYPITAQKLVQSEEVQLGFREAAGTSKLDVELSGESLLLRLQSTFDKIAYEVSAKTPIVDEILKGVVADVPTVTLDAGVKGSWTALRFDFDSNLGMALQKGFERQLQAKINEAKGKLQKLIDAAIGGETSKLVSEFSQSQGDINKLLKSKESAINELKGTLEKEKNKVVSGQKSKLQEEGQKAVDDLKKRFGL